MNWRIVAVISFFGIIYSFLLFNIFNLQIEKHDQYLALAENQNIANGLLPARRGVIYFTDKSGNKIPAVGQEGRDEVNSYREYYNGECDTGRKRAATHCHLDVSRIRIQYITWYFAEEEASQKCADACFFVVPKNSCRCGETGRHAWLRTMCRKA